MSENNFNRPLRDLPVGHRRHFTSLPSTNRYALEWIHEHPPEYSLVICDEQTAGYGRHQRIWYAQPGASLTFSLILYPTNLEIKELPLFSPLAALALCNALRSKGENVEAMVKWSNDVLLDGKKCAGILAEAVWQGNSLMGLVIGIGVNLCPIALPPQEKLFFPATSLEETLGEKVDRAALLHDILENLFALRSIFPSPEFLQCWRQRLAFLGQPVSISNPAGETHTGIFQDVDKHGYLLLKDKAGRLRSFPIGDVSLRPEDSSL